jgi:hypothetical protein
MRSRNHCCRGKIISIRYAKCVFVASVTQHAKCMRRIKLYPVAFPALPFSPTLSQNVQFSHKKKVTELKMCVLIFSTTFV